MVLCLQEIPVPNHARTLSMTLLRSQIMLGNALRDLQGLAAPDRPLIKSNANTLAQRLRTIGYGYLCG